VLEGEIYYFNSSLFLPFPLLLHIHQLQSFHINHCSFSAIIQYSSSQGHKRKFDVATQDSKRLAKRWVRARAVRASNMLLRVSSVHFVYHYTLGDENFPARDGRKMYGTVDGLFFGR
jgi:hypothetical protein